MQSKHPNPFVRLNKLSDSLIGQFSINAKRTSPPKERDISFTCEVCKKVFQRKYNLFIHMSSVHLKDNIYECKRRGCEKKFTCKSNLRRHEKNHLYKGSDCVELGKTNGNLMGNLWTSKYKCKLCQRPFHSYSVLEKHVTVVHTGERAFKCERPGCTKTFNWKGGLNRHLMGHLDEESGRIFRCSKCRKVFKGLNSLKSHRFNVHGSGSGRFACYFCSRISTQMSSLTYHLRIHTKEMPYNCPRCNKDFNRSSNLKAHLKRKH